MNHSQRKYEPALSDIFSSDVLHSILSSPTDTLQALNEAVDNTNVKNVTQSTKVKLQKFYNNDFVVRFNGSFADVRSDLRKLFSMDREGATDYVIYDVPNGRMAFRLADHNANGNNFEQDSANTNISVYVAIREFDVPSSKTSYTEFKITEETFNKNRELTIRAIIDAVRNALNGQEFNIPESIAQRKDYPITESKINSNMKQNKKTITEVQLRDIVAESVKRVLNENVYSPYPSYPNSLDDYPNNEYSTNAQTLDRSIKALAEEVSLLRNWIKRKDIDINWESHLEILERYSNYISRDWHFFKDELYANHPSNYRRVPND